jgi:hypothetical protein
MMKGMQAQGIEWGEDYRVASRGALVEILERAMARGIDGHLEEMAANTSLSTAFSPKALGMILSLRRSSTNRRSSRFVTGMKMSVPTFCRGSCGRGVW